MTATDEAVIRVRAYLTEMDRVDRALPTPTYADEVHGINDYCLARSDLWVLVGALEAIA